MNQIKNRITYVNFKYMIKKRINRARLPYKLGGLKNLDYTTTVNIFVYIYGNSTQKCLHNILC